MDYFQYLERTALSSIDLNLTPFSSCLALHQESESRTARDDMATGAQMVSPLLHVGLLQQGREGEGSTNEEQRRRTGTNDRERVG
jgi:hypothetical protein